MKSLKKNWYWLLLLVLFIWYGYYAGQENTRLWYDEHPPKMYLIVRQQPDAKQFDFCMLSVDAKNVISIMENGDLGANFDSKTMVHNCKFQWVRQPAPWPTMWKSLTQ